MQIQQTPRFSGTTYFVADHKNPVMAEDVARVAEQGKALYWHLNYLQETGPPLNGIQQRDVVVVSHPANRDMTFMSLGQKHGITPIQGSEELTDLTESDYIKRFLQSTVFKRTQWRFSEMLHVFQANNQPLVTVDPSTLP